MTIVITKYERQFPELSYMMGYFNQDWKYIFDWEGTEPNFEAVVGHFKAVDPPETVAQATAELEQFLALSLGEEELYEVVVHDLGACYYPPGDGLTYQQWLEEVLAILREPQDKARTLRFVR